MSNVGAPPNAANHIRRPATAVRALIAREVLGPHDSPPVIGHVELREHQRDAVRRLRHILRHTGGALLADEPGLGKTYVAAALAREAEHPLVVAPAALRGMWAAALEAAGARASFTSYEALSRGGAAAGQAEGEAAAYDLLILDEAHHARTPGTRRYARLAQLAARARVLLLSATPIHNARTDLVALLALFLGDRARSLGEAALARCIVRRRQDDVGAALGLPIVSTHRPVDVGDDAAMLHAILDLPPPVPAKDAGDGGALLAWSLVRQWASSHGALAGAIRRRLVRAAALSDALASERYPSRAELAAWCSAEGAVQLAFAELLVPPSPDPLGVSALLVAVQEHERSLRALLAALERAPPADAVRAERLREIRVRHAGEKIIAFSGYADTVAALWRLLRGGRGVCALTSRGAVVAGGALTRREALRRFAPVAAGAPAPRDAERIDLLLTTDLLSEGVNLQDASVVVHLDLPWTPARLEQRVGRSRRLGARHARTAVYAFAPPASAEAVLGTERRLREKLRVASRHVGIAGAILPTLVPVVAPAGAHGAKRGAVATADAHGDGRDTSPVRAQEELRAALAEWLDPEDAPSATSALQLPGVAVVRAPRDGFVALLATGNGPILVGAVGDDGVGVGVGDVTDDAGELLALVRDGGGLDATFGVDDASGRIERALRAIEVWVAARSGAATAGVVASVTGDARRRALRRIAVIAARAPRHERPLLAPLAASARRVVAARYGVGAERVLGELAVTEMPDAAWLRAVSAFGEAHLASAAPGDAVDSDRAQALLILAAPP